MMPISLDTATHAHIEWLGRLMQALQDHRAPQELRRETEGQCLFGRWLAQARGKGYDPETLRLIDARHEDMHALATILLEAPRMDEAYYHTLERFCRAVLEFNRLIVGLGEARGCDAVTQQHY